MKKELIKALKEESNEYHPMHGIRKGLERAIEIAEKLLEPEEVVIPQFVADHIEFCKSKNKRLNVALSESLEYNMVLEMGVSLEEANDIYARAWLDGYDVHKENLYYVINDAQQLILANNGRIVPTLTDFEVARDEGVLKKYQLTEKEIKEYDPRYWHFTVEVTE